MFLCDHRIQYRIRFEGRSKNQNLRYLDLTGNGLADIIVSEADHFLWYPALGTEGGDELLRPRPARRPRKPRPENKIAPSILRPHVRADDRLLHWKAPYASKSLASARTWLPDQCIHRLFEVVLSSIEPRTRKNYGAGLLRFHQFCDRHKISEALRMPASELLLGAFVSDWAGRVSSGTVDNWLAGLRFWHMSNSAP